MEGHLQAPGSEKAPLGVCFAVAPQEELLSSDSAFPVYLSPVSVY